MNAKLILDALIAVKDAELKATVASNGKELPVYFDMSQWINADPDDHKCGCACCLAGSIVMFCDKPQLDTDGYIAVDGIPSGLSIRTRARNLADMTEDQERILFFGKWPGQSHAAQNALSATLDEAIDLLKRMVSGELYLDDNGIWYQRMKTPWQCA